MPKTKLSKREENRLIALTNVLQCTLTFTLAIGFATLIMFHAPDLFGWVFGMATWLSWSRRGQVKQTFYDLFHGLLQRDDPPDGDPP